MIFERHILWTGGIKHVQLIGNNTERIFDLFRMSDPCYVMQHRVLLDW